MANNNKLFKIDLKKLFFPIVVFVVLVLILLNFSELKEIGRLFSQAKWYFIALAFVSQAVNAMLQTAVYKKIFSVLKMKVIDFTILFRAAVTTIFLNFSIPSLGFAGNIFFVKYLKKRGCKQGKALLAVILEFVCFYAAFIFVLILSFSYMFFKLGSIGATQQLAVGGFILVLMFIGYMVYFWLGNKQKAHRRASWFVKKFNQVEDGRDADEWMAEVLHDFYENSSWLKNNKRKIIKPVLIQIIKFFSDALTIYLIFLAFGITPPLGLPLVAFALGRLFGIITLIPGGIGAFEGAMVLAFNSLGVQLEVAFSVMLIYRFFSYWLYFPFGLAFYKDLMSKKIQHAT